jgi:hypothetical protein
VAEGGAVTAGKLLAAPSLSKLVSDFIEAHDGKSASGGNGDLGRLAQALRALTSKECGVDASVAWHTDQARPLQ